MNYTTFSPDCQAHIMRLLKKTAQKKAQNNLPIQLLKKWNDVPRALKIDNCANHLGFAEIESRAKIVSADFCRERLCNVCAWRRSAKFQAQTMPVLKTLSRNYDFIFLTLTLQNCSEPELKTQFDLMMKAWAKFCKLRKIKRAYRGIIRSFELSYNSDTSKFHPHIHALIAVDKDYFCNDEKYCTTSEIVEFWKQSLNVDYSPICYVESVEESERGAVETLKYALKPTNAEQALKAFYQILKGRRLVSFSGVFARARRIAKMSDFNTVLTDDYSNMSYSFFNVYKFDPTGGIYRFFKTFNTEAD